MCGLRNKVNTAVEKAKVDFIWRKLNQNTRNPKIFWQSINVLIKDNLEIDISNIAFRDPNTGHWIDRENISNVLNLLYC